MTRQDAIRQALNSAMGSGKLMVVYRLTKLDPTICDSFGVKEYSKLYQHDCNHDLSTRYVLPHGEVCKLS